MAAHRVTYIYSRDLTRVADQLPSNLGRASLVHNFISSYDLLDNDTTEGTVNGGEQRARLMKPMEATREELCAFHDEEFIGKFAHYSLPPLYLRLTQRSEPRR